MKRRQGFTFVELMVAMLFMAVLSAMAVPQIREYKTRAYIASMESDLGTLRIAEEVHWAEYQRYTTDTTELDMRKTSNVTVAITSKDMYRGYTAVATHPNLPGRRCSTAMGPEAAPREPGIITCGSTASGGSGTISAP